MSLVSIIIPTYERVEFLEEALESVLNQTYTEFECIVVDGGSSDGTRTLLDSIDDDRLRVVARDRPRGLSSARNAGLDVALGEYIVFLDDDDRLFEHAIQVLVEEIAEQPPDCGGVYAAQRRVYDSGKHRDRAVPRGRVENYEDAAIRGPSCTLIRRSVVDEIGEFDESFPAREDADFWIRLFSAFYMVGVDRVLYERRDHENQLSKDTEQMVAGTERLVEKHSETLSDRKLGSMCHSMAHSYARTGQRGLARSRLRRAIRTDPTSVDNYYYTFWLLFGSPGYRIGRSLPRMYRRSLKIPGRISAGVN